MFKVILILGLCLSTNAFAGKGSSKGKGGFSESYGGDSNISEFQSIARDVVNTLSDSMFYKITKLQAEDVISQIETAVVYCRGNLILDGVEKEAINYPFENPKRIELDCSKWKAALPSNKYRLVIHEYLHLMLVDDSSYEFSSEVVKAYFRHNPYDNGDHHNHNHNLVPERASIDLIYWISSCNIERYKSIAESRGINIYYRLSGIGLDGISVSIEEGCTILLADQMALGAPVENTNMINVSLDNLIFKMAYVTNDKTGYKITELVKIINLLKSYNIVNSNILDHKVDGARYMYLENSSFFKDHRSCLPQSTVLHVLAQEVRTTANEGDRKFIERMYVALIEAGYSDDIKNTCGQTPKSLLLK